MFSSMVDVAQLVESRIVIPVVVGSSPIVHPRISKARIKFGLFLFSWPIWKSAGFSNLLVKRPQLFERKLVIKIKI